MILFVCIHNTCRSVMAEAIFNGLSRRWRAESAGIEPAEEIDPITLEIIRNRGYKIEKTKPVGLEEIKLKDFQLVVTVCDESRCVNIPHPNVERWYIENPKGKSKEVYERVFDELERKIKELLKKIGES